MPVFSVDHGTLDFGSVTAGGAPATRTLTVTNLGVPAADGSSNLGVGAIGISGPDAADFTLVGNTCPVRRSRPGAPAP